MGGIQTELLCVRALSETLPGCMWPYLTRAPLHFNPVTPARFQASTAAPWSAVSSGSCDGDSACLEVRDALGGVLLARWKWGHANLSDDAAENVLFGLPSLVDVRSTLSLIP